jgi:hypothetical protein
MKTVAVFVLVFSMNLRTRCMSSLLFSLPEANGWRQLQGLFDKTLLVMAGPVNLKL